DPSRFDVAACEGHLGTACLEPSDCVALDRHPRGIELRERFLEHGSRAFEIAARLTRRARGMGGLREGAGAAYLPGEDQRLFGGGERPRIVAREEADGEGVRGLPAIHPATARTSRRDGFFRDLASAHVIAACGRVDAD